MVIGLGHESGSPNKTETHLNSFFVTAEPLLLFSEDAFPDHDGAFFNLPLFPEPSDHCTLQKGSSSGAASLNGYRAALSSGEQPIMKLDVCRSVIEAKAVLRLFPLNSCALYAVTNHES